MSTILGNDGPQQETSKELGTSNGDIESDASDEKDVAAELVGEHAQSVDPCVERRAIRKIDWFLIPAMVCSYQNHLWKTCPLTLGRSWAMDLCTTTRSVTILWSGQYL